MLVFHRKEQFDIAANGIKNPFVVIAWQRPGEYSRLFCLWSGGVWLRWFGNKRFCWQWGKGGLTQDALDGVPPREVGDLTPDDVREKMWRLHQSRRK